MSTTTSISRINDSYGYVMLANTRPRNQDEMFKRVQQIVKDTFK